MNKELPYEFDLLYDIKTVGEIRRTLKGWKEEYEHIAKRYADLHRLSREHGIDVGKFPPSIDA